MGSIGTRLEAILVQPICLAIITLGRLAHSRFRDLEPFVYFLDIWI